MKAKLDLELNRLESSNIYMKAKLDLELMRLPFQVEVSNRES